MQKELDTSQGAVAGGRSLAEARRAIRENRQAGELTARQAARYLRVSHAAFLHKCAKSPKVERREVHPGVYLYKQDSLDRLDIRPTQARVIKLNEAEAPILLGILQQYIRAHSDIAPKPWLGWAKRILRRYGV